MGKAFSKKKKNSLSSVLKFLVPILFFALIVIVVLVGVGNVAAMSGEERLKVVEQAVRRAAVQCYAIEGRYPPGLDYLRENYGLLLDKETYVYHYRAVGSNIMPEIAVFVK